jgi:EAL domain-containing protein (putative c-di-GMP-specific phosphodiesterase class I)
MTSSRHSASIMRADAVQALFQPIEDLATGAIVGFEALARLKVGERLIPPAVFLPNLDQDELLCLFREMLGQGIAFLQSLPGRDPRPYLSVNVETSLVMSEDFCAALRATLEERGHAGEGIVLELLEGEAIVDFRRLHARLSQVRELGATIALDDIGSAYSSLINIRDLPIDIIKLDQTFAYGLMDRPEDLHFVLSLLSLARGLGKRLVVEGVETSEIQDAIRVLGAEYAQGYAIARPMAPNLAPAWLAARRPYSIDRAPTTLLGVYAAHLTVVETCQVLMNQPLPISWKEESKNPSTCGIGKYFDRMGLHDTAVGRAHKHFHTVMALCGEDMPRWREGADAFRAALEQALLKTVASPFECRPVAAAG